MNCANCNRNDAIIQLTKHHLIPKIKGGRKEATTILCVDCHRFLNSQFTENEQRNLLNTEEKLITNERMIKFSKFARKQRGIVKQKDSTIRRRKRRK